MSWLDTFGNNENSISANDYVTLKNGEYVEGVFLGEPYMYFRIWGEKPYKEYDKKVDGSNFKFKFNFFTMNNELKIYRGGFKLLKQIRDLIKEYGQNTVFKIKREGLGTDTVYTLMFKSKISDADFKKMNELKLFNFYNSKKQLELAGGEDIPF